MAASLACEHVSDWIVLGAISVPSGSMDVAGAREGWPFGAR